MDDNQKVLTEISVKVGRLEAMQENTTESIKELTTSIGNLVNQLKDTDNMSRDAISKIEQLQQKVNENDKKITKIESVHGWIIKTVGGAIILALLGLILIQQ